LRRAHHVGLRALAACAGLALGLIAAGGSALALAPSGYTGISGTPQGCAAGVDADGFAPNQYLSAYGYSQLQQQGLLGQHESVALIEIDGFNPSDIRTFAACFGLHVPPIHAHAVGIPKLLAPGGEATLDLELLLAAAPELSSISVYETSPDAVHVLQALTAPLRHPGFPPDVISASLGLCESDTLGAVGHRGIASAEAALADASAEGISVLGSSGDTGSAACLQSSGGTTTPVPKLGVIFPASSPWVTAVGGTNLALNAANQITGQVVWNDASASPGVAGGGGLSMLFRRPAYQNGVVAASHRALPDVALLSDVEPGYDAYCTATLDCHGRGWMTFGGTSAATPLLAGGFALVDELLDQHEEQPLGLANPLIYRFARRPPGGAPVFYDVTSGSNDVGPYIQADGQPLGFDEASGWGGIDLNQFALDADLAQPALAQIGLRLAAHQHPYARRGIAATVSCSGACDLDVRVKVTIAGQQPFTDYSGLIHERRRTTARVRVGFTSAELSILNLAMHRGRQISANVTAAVVEPSGQVERQTPTLALPITG